MLVELDAIYRAVGISFDEVLHENIALYRGGLCSFHYLHGYGTILPQSNGLFNLTSPGMINVVSNDRNDTHSCCTQAKGAIWVSLDISECVHLCGTINAGKVRCHGSDNEGTSE